MLKSAYVSKASIGLAGALVALAAAPAVAQAVVDEVIVTGRYGVGPEVRSLSTPVSFRDLDLATEAGRGVLRDRVRAAAQDLCRRLGENGLGSTAAAPSCEQDAVNSAQAQERVAFDQARAPVYAVAVPPPDEPYVAPAGAPAAPSYGEQAAATVTTETVTNGPVPDTPQNRARFGGPTSNGGRRTAPAGN